MRTLPRVFLLLVCALSAEAVEPATTPAIRNTWLEHHERLNDLARKGGVDVLFLGDSITHRWTGDGRETWERVLLPLRSANFGISGDRTEHLLWRLQNGNLEGLRPKVVVLQIGTNNRSRDRPAQVVAGVLACVREVRARLPESRVLLLGVFPVGESEDAPARRQIVEINRLLAASERDERVTFLDIGEAFLRPDGALDRKKLPDGLHPGKDGYRAWAEAMKPTLDGLLRETARER